MNYTHQYRQDLISGKWIIMANNRHQRPDQFQKSFSFPSSSRDPGHNPFHPIVSELDHNEQVNLVMRDESGEGIVYNVANKFPIVRNDITLRKEEEGPYQAYRGYGTHELFIYKDPHLPVRDFSEKRIQAMFQAFQKRSLQLMHDQPLKHIFIFHNDGYRAGASVVHPHSQLLASTIVPQSICQMLSTTQEYHNRHKRSAFTVMLNHEREDGRRIVAENDDFLALCPYASENPYQIDIFPKEHKPHFPFISEDAHQDLAQIYKHVLQLHYHTLGELDYNMYLFTAPCDGKGHEYFRWFIRLIPQVSIPGGYESGVDMPVCTVLPEQAAEELTAL